MYGEPSAYEYGKMIEEANKKISTHGFNCCHNNLGWCGYFITTPKGNKYTLVQRPFKEGYSLCEYNRNDFLGRGRSLGIQFKDLDECKEYLLLKEKEE